MADEEVKTYYVFEERGATNVQRQIRGVASAFTVSKNEANKAARDVRDLKRYLEFAKNTKSAKELEYAMKKVQQIMNRVSDRSMKGMRGQLNSLNTAQKRQLITLQKQTEALKKSRGMTNSFTQGIKGAIPALGMMATGVGAITLVGQKLVRMFTDAVNNVKEFIKSSVSLGAEQEEGRIIMQALVGDIERGTIAYDEFDKRVTDSPFKREAYNLRDYASAVKVGMGGAYLDAAEAGDVYNFSAASFVENMYKMENGLLRSANTLGQFKDVLEHTGIDIEDVKNGTISYKEVVEEMKIAVKEMADEQRRAAGEGGRGTLNLIRNQWYDIKEAAGEFLVKFLKPIGKELLQALKEGRDFKEIWALLKEAILPGITAAIGFIVINIRGAVKTAGVLNDVLGRLRTRIEPGTEAMINLRNIIKGAIRDTESLGKVASNTMNIMLELSKGPLLADINKVKRLREENKELMEGLRVSGAESARGKKGQRVEDLTEPPPPPPSGGGGAGATGANIPSWWTIEKAGAQREMAARMEEARMRKVTGPVAPLREAPGVTGDLETQYQEVIEKAMKDKETAAAITGSFAIGIKDALISGDIKGAFADLGLEIANKMLAQLILAGIVQMFTGGGFMSTFIGGMGGYEREGLVKRPTYARIAESRPEFVLNPSTVRAIAQGFTPSGGRSDARYGPGDYAGGGGDTVINVNPRVGPWLDIEVEKSARRGRALLGQREA